MGYYTCYSMEARNIKDRAEFDSLIAALKAREVVIDYDNENSFGIFNNYSFDTFYNTASFESYDEHKWYDHDKDMIKISAMFPDIVFCLHGEGEEHDDLWNAYYSNGKSETCRARIVYDDPKTIKW